MTSSNAVGCCTGIFRWVGAAQDFVGDLHPGADHMGQPRSIGGEAAGLGLLGPLEYPGQPCAVEALDDERARIVEDRRGEDVDGADLRRDKLIERAGNRRWVRGLRRNQLEVKGLGRARQLCADVDRRRVGEDTDPRRRRNELVQQLQPLDVELAGQRC